MEMQGEQYLDARQLAKRYRVHIQSIWRWNAEKRLPPAAKFGGGTTRWKLSDLEAWERSRTQAHQPGAAA